MIKDLKIVDISYDGSGVGKKDGKVIFVPKTLVGEFVDVELVKENSKFAIAKAVSVKRTNANRCEPACKYYNICGGCDFQHCTYQHELFLKEKILRGELNKVGFCGDIKINKSDDRYFYRNKLKLEVVNSLLGYFEPKSHTFFEVENCPIASQDINHCLSLVSQYLRTNSDKDLKNIYIKEIGGGIGICFLFDKNSKKMHKKFKKNDILGDFSVFFAYGDVLESNKTEVFCVQEGRRLKQNAGDCETKFDISAFNQVNDNVSKKLYEYIKELTKDKRVVNAYSGQGLLTKMISGVAKMVYGIEYQLSAHKVANQLTKDIRNVENICGKVEDELSTVLLRDKIDMIILDPARAGCENSVLNAIKCQKIAKIVYISCNFSTLVRDLQILKQFYDIESVQIFDMFPCTANMETVVVLTRK